MKIVAVIPAHMASVRFPGKILFPFHGIPMIEHVRRRALLSKGISEVIVATCDTVIAEAVRDNGGKVIMTSDTHSNGTSRVAEAIKSIECTHVILLQGDEPLLLPRHVEALIKAIQISDKNDAWNATGPIEYEEELNRHSFVKCVTSKTGRIMHCFRRSPSYSDFNQQKVFIRKILGLIAYSKEFLMKLTLLSETTIEIAESIEQMRIIENDFLLQSVQVSPSLPSVNEPHEAKIVLEYLMNNPEQKDIFKKVISGNSLD